MQFPPKSLWLVGLCNFASKEPLPGILALNCLSFPVYKSLLFTVSMDKTFRFFEKGKRCTNQQKDLHMGNLVWNFNFKNEVAKNYPSCVAFEAWLKW